MAGRRAAMLEHGFRGQSPGLPAQVVHVGHGVREEGGRGQLCAHRDRKFPRQGVMEIESEIEKKATGE